MGSMVPISLLACITETMAVRGVMAWHGVRVHQALPVHRQDGDLVALLLQEMAGLQHRVVLDGGGDDVVLLLAGSIQDPLEGVVVSLGAAAGRKRSPAAWPPGRAPGSPWPPR